MVGLAVGGLGFRGGGWAAVCGFFLVVLGGLARCCVDFLVWSYGRVTGLSGFPGLQWSRLILRFRRVRGVAP